MKKVFFATLVFMAFTYNIQAQKPGDRVKVIDWPGTDWSDPSNLKSGTVIGSNDDGFMVTLDLYKEDKFFKKDKVMLLPGIAPVKAKTDTIFKTKYDTAFVTKFKHDTIFKTRIDTISIVKLKTDTIYKIVHDTIAMPNKTSVSDGVVVTSSKTAMVYKVGDKVEVAFGAKWLAATILVVNESGYKVHYSSLATTFDETVSTNRIRPVKIIGSIVKVYSDNAWADATILQYIDGKYLIHYLNRANAADEWFTSDKIRF